MDTFAAAICINACADTSYGGQKIFAVHFSLNKYDCDTCAAAA